MGELGTFIFAKTQKLFLTAILHESPYILKAHRLGSAKRTMIQLVMVDPADVLPRKQGEGHIVDKLQQDATTPSDSNVLRISDEEVDADPFGLTYRIGIIWIVYNPVRLDVSNRPANPD
jgi:hypothetical protein